MKQSTYDMNIDIANQGIPIEIDGQQSIYLAFSLSPNHALRSERPNKLSKRPRTKVKCSVGSSFHVGVPIYNKLKW